MPLYIEAIAERTRVMRSAIEYRGSARQGGGAVVDFLLAALPLVTVLACCGCISSGQPIEQDRLAQIKIGESTRAEVQRIMGEPHACSASDASEGDTTLMYMYHKGWLIPPGEMLSSILSLAHVPGGGMLKRLWTGGSSECESVTIVCDRDSRVSGISTYLWKLESGGGLLDRNEQSFSWTTRRILNEDARVYQGAVGAALSGMTEVATGGEARWNLAAAQVNVAAVPDPDEPTTEPTAPGRTCSFEIISNPGDAGFDAIETAFRTRTAIELAILDKSRETTGAQGPKGSFSIISFNPSDASEGANTVSVKAELVVFDEWLILQNSEQDRARGSARATVMPLRP